MSEYGIFWGKDVMKATDGQREPIIEHLLWEGDTIFIIGKEKVGKSILSLQMACNLTSGEDFLDTFKVKQEYSVAYIQTEGKRYETQERLDNMFYGLHCNLDNFTHIFLPGIALDTPQGIKDLESMMTNNARHPSVIFIDPLYMSMEGDMKDAKAARAWIGNVRGLAGKYNATLVINHHAHRQRRDKSGQLIAEGDDAIYGSFVWKAFADHTFMMYNNNNKAYTLTCDTQRSAKVINKVSFVLHHPKPLLFTIEDSDSSIKAIMIFKLLQEKRMSDADTMIAELGLSRSTVYRALRKLMSTNMIEKSTSRPTSYRILNKD